MSKNAHLIYPHQLFAANLLPQGITHVFVIEDPLFFGTDVQYPVMFHKQKLMLHRASMRRYIEEVLWPAGYDVEYIEYKDIVDSGDVLQRLKGYDSVSVFDVVDDVLSRRLLAASTTIPEVPQLQVLDTPNFYLKRSEVASYFAGTKTPSFSAFYQWQRERWNILIGDNYKPVGNKWIIEPETHKRLPKDHQLPTFEVYGSNKYVEEARHYVDKNFADNPGNSDAFCWATNQQEAADWLESFVNGRLDEYGTFKDALDGHAPWVYHSALSPALNIGLLTPQQVVAAALDRHQKKPVELVSLESFIRGVLGWREYMRGVYVTKGVTLRTSNPYEHKRQLTQDWYVGTTGLPPVDDAIKKVYERAYLHHSERLMVIGNAMFISQIDPKEVYTWHMEMCIDAYDWTVVPNVFAISQYVDGGTISTKPNISSSTYLLQMSWYQKDVWCDVWDGLYWNFIYEHKDMLVKNPHTKPIVQQLRRLNEDRMRIIGYRASDFLNAKTKVTQQNNE